MELILTLTDFEDQPRALMKKIIFGYFICRLRNILTELGCVFQTESAGKWTLKFALAPLYYVDDIVGMEITQKHVFHM